MEVIGYALALLVGISLGMLGSGGSILTVPVMVYLLRINPVDATGYSLLVVGITSAIGCITYIRSRMVDLRIALVFAVPSIIGVYFTRKFLMPLLPDTVLALPSFTLSKEVLIMILYALLMIIVAWSMIRPAAIKSLPGDPIQKIHYAGLFGTGIMTGMLTGFFGVGGGFLIVPALVLMAKIPIRMAVGTSLLIIAFNSLSGFFTELLERHELLDYEVLGLFTALSVSGIFVGIMLSLKLNPAVIKRIFGWAILMMGTGILLKEILQVYPA